MRLILRNLISWCLVAVSVDFLVHIEILSWQIPTFALNEGAHLPLVPTTNQATPRGGLERISWPYGKSCCQGHCPITLLYFLLLRGGNETDKCSSAGKAPRHVKVNLKLPKIKPLHTEWLVKVYTDMQDKGSQVVRFFQKAGIADALSIDYLLNENPFD